MISINEIFYSIQGETSLAGLRTVFVRTSGCNLRCTYCDTTYAYGAGTKWTQEDLINEIKKYNTPYVCITGGEPLLQKEMISFLDKLCNQGFHVSLETSGDQNCTGIDPRVLKIIDIKTPDSGAANSFNESNLSLNDVNTEFKFVICSEKDFVWAEFFVEQHQLSINYPVLYSPSFQEIDAKWLANKILSECSNVRLHLQQHKYIWSPEARGV